MNSSQRIFRESFPTRYVSFFMWLGVFFSLLCASLLLVHTLSSLDSVSCHFTSIWRFVWCEPKFLVHDNAFSRMFSFYEYAYIFGIYLCVAKVLFLVCWKMWRWNMRDEEQTRVCDFKLFVLHQVPSMAFFSLSITFAHSFFFKFSHLTICILNFLFIMEMYVSLLSTALTHTNT